MPDPRKIRRDTELLRSIEMQYYANVKAEMDAAELYESQSPRSGISKSKSVMKNPMNP